MKEQKGGRQTHEGKKLYIVLTPESEKKLNEIMQVTGSATTAEAIRYIIYDFHRRNVEKKEEKT